VVQGYLGLPYLRGAAKRLRQGETDMDTLVALGTDHGFHRRRGRLVGRSPHDVLPRRRDDSHLRHPRKYLEAKARHRTGEAIRKLIELAPTDATILIDGKPRSVPVAEVEVARRWSSAGPPYDRRRRSRRRDDAGRERDGAQSLHGRGGSSALRHRRGRDPAMCVSASPSVSVRFVEQTHGQAAAVSRRARLEEDAVSAPDPPP